MDNNTKWVKVSALPSSRLSGAASFWNNFTPGGLRILAANAFRLKPLRDFITSKFPGLGGRIGPKTFVNNFIEALADPEFQVVAMTGIMQFMGQGMIPQEAYKPEAFEQLFGTKGYAGESIAAGAYQKTTGKLPPREILPKMTIQQFEAQLRAIGNDPNLAPVEKMRKLTEFLGSVESSISSFSQFLNREVPFVRSLTGG